MRDTIYIFTEAADPAAAAVTGMEDMTSRAMPTMTAGDSPEFTFLFTDGTATPPAWAGDSDYTITVGLGPIGRGRAASSTSDLTTTSGGWIGILPLNAWDFLNWVKAQPRSTANPVLRAWLTVSVAAPSGKERTYLLARTPIRIPIDYS